MNARHERTAAVQNLRTLVARPRNAWRVGRLVQHRATAAALPSMRGKTMTPLAHGAR